MLSHLSVFKYFHVCTTKRNIYLSVYTFLQWVSMHVTDPRLIDFIHPQLLQLGGVADLEVDLFPLVTLILQTDTFYAILA